MSGGKGESFLGFYFACGKIGHFFLISRTFPRAKTPHKNKITSKIIPRCKTVPLVQGNWPFKRRTGIVLIQSCSEEMRKGSK